MKKFITLLVAMAVMCMVTSAMALQSKEIVLFNNYSATSGTAVKSSVVNVRGFKTKSITVQGIAVAGHANAALSGTVLAECAPTNSGPWNTCINSNYAQTAVSTTANGILTWSDASPYVRASWAKTAGEVKVWLNYTE